MTEGVQPVAAALQVAIVAPRADAALLRRLVVDTGVAISVTACDGLASALAHMAEAPCDAVVLEIADAAGLDTVARLHERSPTTAVIVLAGADGVSLRDLALAHGAQDCLTMDERRPDLLAYALRHAAARARRERGVHEHAAELRLLFDFNPHPMWMFDARTLKFLAVNRVALAAYGFSEREFLAMSVADIRADGPGTRLNERIGGDSVPRDASGIWRHRKKNGGEIEVEVFVQAVPQWGQDVCLAQARDVTAERRAMRTLEASERRFRDFFQHSTGFICIHDLDGTLLSVNPATATALGRSVAELLGTPLRNLAPPELRFLSDNYLQRVVQNGEDAGFMRVLDRAGEVLVWQYSNRVYIDADGSSYVMGYAQDITAMRAVEQALQLSERRLRTVADTLPLKIAYVDAQQRFVFANEAFRHAYANEGDDITGAHVRDLLGESLYARRQPYLERALVGERVTFEDEEGEGDDYQCVEITFIPETAEKDASVIGVHAMVQDVTSKKREERRLIQLARVDHLTGLMNRAGFYERLDNAIEHSRNLDSLLVVFYLDIDRFKQVNDTYGHAVGDALIRAFAVRLGEKVRASDAVARLGGDEFTVVMEGFPDIERVRMIAKKLVAAMSLPFDLRSEGVTLSIGASIGIAACRGGPLTAPALVARADAMLYEAKEAGRGTYRIETISANPEPAASD
jgi:diguanylate cyclase (GGDEF)-like protein/PAS domain S-box-containing protein